MWKKSVCKKMMMEKKCLQRHICSKKVFAEDNFSSSPPHPVPTTLQKNNGPSLMGTSYLEVLL